MKKRWTDEENKIFSDIFKIELCAKKMPRASSLLKAAKELKGRTVQQIRKKIII